MRFDTNDAQDFGQGLEEVWQNTTIGREYLRGYHSEETFEQDFDLIRRTAVRVAGQISVSDDEIARALYLLIQSGLIKPRKVAAAPIEETPADRRPRDKNGKLLTDGQIAWGEMTRWANEHSSEECRARAHNDEAFQKFMQTRLRQEMNVPIGDAVKPVGYVEKPVVASADVKQFAYDYQHEKSENLRPKGGFVTIAGKPMPYAEFKIRVDAAIAAGLI